MKISMKTNIKMDNFKFMLKRDMGGSSAWDLTCVEGSSLFRFCSKALADPTT